MTATMPLALTDQKVLVTGASGGIGAAVARLVTDRGGHALLMDLPSRAISALADELGAPFAIADLTDPRQVSQAVDQLIADGVPNALVNVAGVNTRESFLSLSLSDWDRIVSVNLRGTFLVGQQVMSAMTAVSQPGSVVNVASIGAWQPYPGLSHYETAKAGVLALTRAAAAELADRGIRVNAVAPGVVDTPMTAETLADVDSRNRRLDKIPLGRFGKPDDVAQAVCFLLSDAASWITGSTLTVDGGQSLK